MAEHGGRRAGAGRPAGSAWKPVVAQLRTVAAERLTEIVGSPTDPLDVAISIACDDTQDVQIRLGACAVVLPYLYPRLAASTVHATHVTATVDSAELLNRISERIARQQISSPSAVEGTVTTEPEPAAA